MLNPKLLLRKPGTPMAILAIALLAAIIASMNSIVNYVNAQSEALASLVQIGETYTILSQNATSITESQIDAELAKRLSEVAGINQMFPQKVLTANLKTESGVLTVNVRAVENVEGFLMFRRARVNGTIAKSWMEADVGEVLSRTANISLNDTITLSNREKVVDVRVVGIFRAQSELDAEMIIPMENSNSLFIEDGKISIIEFSLKENVDREKALNRIAEKLPETVKVVKVQQPGTFMQEANAQTTAFLDIWSLAVYAVVAAASYMITGRLTAESAYELTMLKALGAKKGQIFTLIITYTAATAVLASILGIALGVAAAQTASTLLRWLQLTVEIAPFLQAEQTLETIVLTLLSSILGCAYPAYRSARLGYLEQPL
jgi:ABC-type lipoprotein release transport system permease subunit